MEGDSRRSVVRLFFSFMRLGMTAFGGPAMVAYIRDMAVVRHKWLDDGSFSDGIVLCQSVPGATAMQAAAYVGFRTRGVAGALASYVGFGLPAFILMVALSSVYSVYRSVPGIASLFNGLQVVVVAIIASATYSFGRPVFRHTRELVTAAAASTLFAAGLSPFIVIIAAAVTGPLVLRHETMVPVEDARRSPDVQLQRQLLCALLIVLSALGGLYLLDRALFGLAALMMKIDLFAFGGGFASLPLMLHEIVDVRGWIDNKTFMDGIALGQVTPGPIVITTTFVGYMVRGFAGATVATVAVFAPSFLMVVTVTPVFDRLRSSLYFISATKGILASFVGLLFFVAVKFGSDVPWDPVRLLFACAAFAALLKKVDILYVVLIAGAASLLLF